MVGFRPKGKEWKRMREKQGKKKRGERGVIKG